MKVKKAVSEEGPARADNDLDFAYKAPDNRDTSHIKHYIIRNFAHIIDYLVIYILCITHMIYQDCCLGTRCMVLGANF